jgi:hypothetical protein
MRSNLMHSCTTENVYSLAHPTTQLGSGTVATLIKLYVVTTLHSVKQNLDLSALCKYVLSSGRKTPVARTVPIPT